MESSSLLQQAEDDSAQEKSGREPLGSLTCFSLFMFLFAALGGFLFGYDTGVISGALILIKTEFHLTAFWQELIVSVTIATAILGALLGGVLNEQLGRKPVLFLSAAVCTAGAVIMAVARSKEVLLVGRFIVGIGIGGASMTAPVYIAEASLPHLRGQLVVFYQIFITGGQFLASLIDGLFSTTEQGWRYMLGVAALPSFVMFLGCLLLPESPRWLVKHGSVDEARRVLVKIRGNEEVEHELQEMENVIKQETGLQQERGLGVLVKMLTLPGTRKALAVGCALQAVQQLTGINLVMYYSATIILMSGVGSKRTAIWFAALVAFLNFLFSWVGYCLIDRVGRRKLLLASLAGSVLGLLLLGGAFQIFTTTSPKVVFKETSLAGQPLDTCRDRTSCMKCVQLDTCGFCHAFNGKNEQINGSCVAVNSTVQTVAAYGRCSGKQNKDFKWNYGVCPSTYAWLAILGLAIYIAFFASGMGPVPWTLNSEIYPLWARSVGSSCATAVNWSLNLLVSMTFLHLMEWISPAGTFWFYMSFAAVGWVFFYFSVPETKGKSLEELEKLF